MNAVAATSRASRLANYVSWIGFGLGMCVVLLCAWYRRHDLTWPSEPDLYRDLGTTNALLDGNLWGDHAYPGRASLVSAARPCAGGAVLPGDGRDTSHRVHAGRDPVEPAGTAVLLPGGAALARPPGGAGRRLRVVLLRLANPGCVRARPLFALALAVCVRAGAVLRDDRRPPRFRRGIWQDARPRRDPRRVRAPESKRGHGDTARAHLPGPSSAGGHSRGGVRLLPAAGRAGSPAGDCQGAHHGVARHRRSRVARDIALRRAHRVAIPLQDAESRSWPSLFPRVRQDRPRSGGGTHAG